MTPDPLVIDCDPGVDDALALLLAAASPEVDLRAVTCVAGNRPVDQAARNACRVLDLAGRGDVPVHAGCSRPLTQPEPRCNLVHGEDGLAGVALPHCRAPSGMPATEVLERMLLDAPAGHLTLAAIGPLTNLALAEIKRWVPDLRAGNDAGALVDRIRELRLEKGIIGLGVAPAATGLGGLTHAICGELQAALPYEG